MTWVDFVLAANLAPRHSVFQSWVYPCYTTGPGPNEIPINLPEDDPSIYSHTRLLNEALDLSVRVASDPSTDLPANPGLHQNYPNPFNPTTFIAYEVSKSSEVSLKVYNALGREIQTLVSNLGHIPWHLTREGFPAASISTDCKLGMASRRQRKC